MLTTNGESLVYCTLRGITLEIPSSVLASNPKAAVEQGYYEGPEADDLEAVRLYLPSQRSCETALPGIER
jgi:hypothetical protein